MKPILLFIISLLIALISCEKEENKSNLTELCNVRPDGWECEIITDDFNSNDLPRDAGKPLAIIKFKNPEREFLRYHDRIVNPSLILDLYNINQKHELIDFIISQQVFSWCIPLYYGETEDYFIITSPCFVNYGAFTEEANSLIEDLHTSLKSLIVVKEYDGLIPFNTN